jgi:hypothetical protein
MPLILLLLVPLAIGGIAFALSGKKINLKELAITESLCILFVLTGWYSDIAARGTDVEIWNGRIASKTSGTEHCCHSYDCNCREICSGSGEDESCFEKCDTCYEHDQDKWWAADTTNSESAFSSSCNPPSTREPARWTQIRVGEPTAIEHRYENLIKASPESIFSPVKPSESDLAAVPDYPRVSDLYRVNRVLSSLPLPDLRETQEAMEEANADLGAKKQVNMMIVATSSTDRSFAEAVRRKWLGGKKNDVILVVGVNRDLSINWAEAVSWTKKSEVGIDLRDRVQSLSTWNGASIAGIMKEVVSKEFVRREMSDFDYLRPLIEPTSGVKTFLLVGGMFVSILLSALFWANDPFGEETR